MRAGGYIEGRLCTALHLDTNASAAQHVSQTAGPTETPMTTPTIALLTVIGLLVITAIASRNRNWVYVCPQCGFTALPKGHLIPAACPNRHRMKVMFPGSAYALIMFLGDIAMCVLVVHFVIQRFIPWSSRYFAWIVLLGVVGAVKDLVTIPALVSNQLHRSSVNSHYRGAIVGHVMSMPFLLLVLDMRNI